MNTKLRVKSDEYQFVLYQEGTTRTPNPDDPMDKMPGYRVIGHYSNIDSLLKGVAYHLARVQSKKARDLEDFLKVVVSGQREILAEIKKIAFLAQKTKPRPGAQYAVREEVEETKS